MAAFYVARGDGWFFVCEDGHAIWRSRNEGECRRYAAWLRGGKGGTGTDGREATGQGEGFVASLPPASEPEQAAGCGQPSN